MQLPKVSLVVPCYNEEAFIEGILLDIEKQSYPKDLIELFVVDGRSTDRTKDVFKKTQQEISYTSILIDNPARIAPIAMNLGIKASYGDYIFIWGAHASYPNNFIRQMIELALESRADCVGAVCKTLPRTNTAKGRAIATVLQHPLGVGNASFRTGIDEVKEVDTVAFGCYRRDSFEKFGLFHPKLVRNQDIELNKRIVNNGGRILLDPRTNCTYFARSTFSGLWSNNFGNGEWVVKTARITEQFQALSLRHFIPLIFVLGLMSCVALCLINLATQVLPTWFNYLILSPVFVYLLTITIVSAHISLKNKQIKIWLKAILSFAVLHTSYGMGSIKGMISSKKI